MPLPSILLAIVFKLHGGASVPLARAASIVMSSLSVPLMLIFAQKFVPRGPAIASAIACAVYPTWAYVSSSVLSEPYFIPLMLIAIIASAWAAESKTYRCSALAGFAWGIAALVRPHALLMSLAIALLLAFSGWRRAAVLAVSTLLVLAPWTIRNQIQFGHPIVLATEGGETLLGANNPYVLSDPSLHGMWISPLRIAEYNERLSVVHDDLERDRLQSAMARSFLAAHVDEIPRLVIYKLARWLTPVTETPGLVRLMVLGSYGLLLTLLFVAAAMRLFKPSASLAHIAACSLVLTAVTIVYWGGLTRGRIPLELIWLPWGAYAGWELVARFVRMVGNTSPLATTASAGA
jgi:hypothetical protein